MNKEEIEARGEVKRSTSTELAIGPSFPIAPVQHQIMSITPGITQPQLALALPSTVQVDQKHCQEPGPSFQSTETKEEKRHILDNVLTSLVVEHDKEFKKLVTYLGNVDLEQQEIKDLEKTLDQLIEDVASVDIANLFYQRNGLAVTARLLGHVRHTIRHRAAFVIAECCMNNSFCRSQSNADNVLGKLMGLAYGDEILMVKYKCLCAVSAIVKENMEGIKQFRKFNGFAMIREFLKYESNSFRRKTAFLIMALCDTDHTMKDDILATGVLSILISYVKVSDDEMAEHYIRALLSLTADHKGATRECRKNNLDLWGHISTILTLKYIDDAAKDLVECCRLLVSRLSEDSMAELQELYPGEYIYNIDDTPPGLASSDDESAGTVRHVEPNESAMALDIKQLDINKK